MTTAFQVATAIVLLTGAIGCGPAPTEGAGSPSLGPKLVFTPLETRNHASQTVAHMELTGLLFLPEDRGLLVWEQAGRISHYQVDGDTLMLQGELHLDGVATGTDCGLISVVLDPDWADNHFLYAAHCMSRTHSAVRRYVFHGDDYDSVAGSGVRVIEFGDAAARQDHHNVGTIGFFPNDRRSMWILVGDKKIPENAQNASKNLGGILRIIPKLGAEGGYEPHPDNPFGGPGSDPSRQSSPDLYAWGLRSPWRGAVDRRGRIWVGEVGNLIEEVNLASAPGQNFGWGKVEGPCLRGAGDTCGEMTNPIAWWGRGSNHEYRLDDETAGPTVRRVAWVGTPYESRERDPYEGLLDDSILAGDMCVGFVRALAVDAHGERVRDEPVGHLIGLSGSAQGPDGHLYVTSYGSCTSDTFGVGGGIYRVDRAREEVLMPQLPEISDAPLVDEPLGPMPLQLSGTGIFADDAHVEPIARAIRYTPAHPLWSNGSGKERWLVLPEGMPIDNTEPRRWKFPVGTLFFKTFNYGAQKVETRVIRRTHAGWDYHAYRWRGSDADLLSLERALPVAIEQSKGKKLTHEVPSRFDCRSCHESNETVIIGFDELRLNSEGQLQALAERGLFTQPLRSAPARIEHEDPQTREVLAYLHGNCAHCHNPSENTMSLLDLTHERALVHMIGRATEGSGQLTGVRVVPGSPERSVLYLALSGEGDDPELQPMPPIGVQVRDATAIERVRAWIADLSL